MPPGNTISATPGTQNYRRDPAARVVFHRDGIQREARVNNANDGASMIRDIVSPGPGNRETIATTSWLGSHRERARHLEPFALALITRMSRI